MKTIAPAVGLIALAALAGCAGTPGSSASGPASASAGPASTSPAPSGQSTSPAGTSSSAVASPGPSGRTEEQVCQLLTAADVTAATGLQASKQQSSSSGIMGEVRCAYYTADGSVMPASLTRYQDATRSVEELLNTVVIRRDPQAAEPGIGTKSIRLLGMQSASDAGIAWVHGDEVWLLWVTAGDPTKVNEAKDADAALALATKVDAKL